MPQRRFRQFAFEQPIVLAAMAAVTIAVVVAFLFSTDLAETWPWLVLTLVICDALLWLPLTLTVEPERIRVSLAGMLRTEIPVPEITVVERRRYHPMRQFGGWGWRHGRDGARQYAQTGSEAVVLTLVDGRQIYLGTRDLDGLRAAVDDARAGRLIG